MSETTVPPLQAQHTEHAQHTQHTEHAGVPDQRRSLAAAGRVRADRTARPAVAAPVSIAAGERRAPWNVRYQRLIISIDVVVITFSVAISLVQRFGEKAATAKVGVTALTYSTFAVLLGVTWLALLWEYGAWDRKVLGSGNSEYKRVVNSTALLFGAIAIISYLGRAEVARGYLAIVLPVGLFGLLTGRVVARGWLRRQRVRGQLLDRVLVIGGHRRATELALHLSRTPSSGYRVTGCVCRRPSASRSRLRGPPRSTVGSPFSVIWTRSPRRSIGPRPTWSP